MQSFTLGDMPMGAPPWLFLLLLFAIFWLHLMSMWFLVGSLILGILGLAKDKANWQSHRVLAYLPVVFALVINLGVPPLLFVQILYGPFFFSSSILLSVPWISVFFLLLLGYGMVYAARYGAKESWQAISFLSISTIAVIAISFIYSNNMSLMIKPDYWQQLYSTKQNGFNLYPNLPEVISRWVWVLSPSLVAGAVLLNKFIKPAIIVSVLLSLLGLVVYKSFWPEAIASYDLVKISLVADLALAGILGVFFLLNIKTGDGTSFNKAIFYIWIALKGAAVVALRHGIRVAALKPVYDLAEIPVRMQPTLIGLFIIITLVSFVVMGWMYIKGRKQLSI